MSKSLGNFLTVRDALKICEPQVLRFFLISAHYRSPIDFNKANLRVAETNLERLFNALERLESLAERGDRTSGEEELLSEVGEARRQFEEAMDDDFNTPLAISILFSIAGAVNSYAESNAEIETSAKKEILGIFRGLLNVLGMEFAVEGRGIDQASSVKGLMDLVVDLRREVRHRKDWETADKIRDRLQELGLSIEDTPEGPKWKARKPI